MAQNRIRLLDILRGFAIIGTLGTNIWIFAYAGNVSSVLTTDAAWFNSMEGIIETLMSVFINGKFLGLLTIMFGIGLELKYRKAEREELPWMKLYIWTMVLLFMDGLLHYIFVFEYDILMSYAVTGIIVAMLIKKSEKALNVIAITAFVIHMIGVTLLSLAWGFAIMMDDSFLINLEKGMVQAGQVYLTGTYMDQIMMRLQDFIILRSEAILILFMNISLYILGVKMYRNGVFASNSEARRTRMKMMKWGLGIGIPLNMLPLLPGGFFEFPARYLFAPVLSLGYVGLFAYILERGWISWVFRRFEMIGKAALSCYVLQNVIAAIIFYSWGFQLAPMTSVYLIIGLFLFITLIMMVLAEIFVRKMGTGPLEWLWKKLSYMPFR